MGVPQAFTSESARLRRGSEPAPSADRENAWASGSQYCDNSRHLHGSTQSFIPDDVDVEDNNAPVVDSTPSIRPEINTGPKPCQYSTKPGEYFCADCQLAKRQPDWTKRLDHMFSESLWCNGCQKKHYLALFDPPDWSDDPATQAERKCFVHKARFRICPHLSLTLAEISETDWHQPHHPRYAGDVFLQCQHPDHPTNRNVLGDLIGAPYVKIVLPTVGSGAFSVHFGVHLDPWKSSDLTRWNQGEDDGGAKAWSSRLVSHDQVDNEIEAEEESRRAISVARVVDLFASSSFMACSHLRKNTYRLAQRATPSVRSYHDCRTCHLEVEIRDPERCSTPIYIEGYWNPGTPYETARDALKILDPDSYDPPTKTSTKNIIWCDDPDCATTFEGRRARLLREHAFNPAWDKAFTFWPRESRLFSNLSELSRTEELDIATLHDVQLAFRGELYPTDEERREMLKKAVALYGFKVVEDRIAREGETG
jgi:hypothetical protein